MGIIYAESTLLQIPIHQRYDICYKILKTDDDESLRGEAVWVLGKSLEDTDGFLRQTIEDLLEDVLKNDNNAVVKHEASFQIGEHNVMRKLPALIEAALKDPSELVRHESIEAIGLLKAFEAKCELKKALSDPNEAVKQTAKFVLKQLDRLEKVKIAKD